ncbi:MAG: deoxyribonuclease I, partial [Lentilactobacillus hilgardii]
MPKVNISRLYEQLLTNMGPQGWWPAETKPEIILGAILVQNTNWQNVEKSLANLRDATALVPVAIGQLADAELKQFIKPSGFFTNKARAIRAVWHFFEQYQWNYQLIVAEYGNHLRERLLDITGIGPESADVLLVYVFDVPVFIADKYARTLFSFLTGQSYRDYQALKNSIDWPPEFSQLEAKELHGLIDEFGKVYLKNEVVFEKSFLGQRIRQITVD